MATPMGNRGRSAAAEGFGQWPGTAPGRRVDGSSMGRLRRRMVASGVLYAAKAVADAPDGDEQGPVVAEAATQAAT